MQNIKKETPRAIKELFKAFLFPCREDKSPALGKDQSWLSGNPEKKEVIRSIEATLCGLDCGQAGIVVVDFDTYKDDFKKSKEAQIFFKECKDKSKFCYKTPRGGHHFFFKGKIKSFNPHPGVEIKAQGGYVCLYSHPAPQANYEDWDSFYDDLPVFDFTEWGKEQTKKREFGPGKNHYAIPQRAGKAGAHADLKAMEEDLTELLFKNRNNTHEIKKHLKDYMQKFRMSIIWKSLTPKAQKNIKDITEDIQKEIELTKVQTLSEKDIKKPEAFVQDFLLDYEFNFVGGPTKLGKSRAILSILSKRLQATKQTGLILSTENDQHTMMAPLLKELNAFNNFAFIPDEASKYFNSQSQTGPDKASAFVTRINNILTDNEDKSRCLLIDPLPRFFDWNNEVTVTTFIDGLRLVAKETKTCIIGIRNDGKAKDYDDVHKTKGSSALADISRQIIRAIPCHRRSALGKENKKVKSFVLFTERSGLFKEVAFLFQMKVRKQKDFDVAVPEQIKQLKESIDTVKYLCTRESGQTARQKIVEYIEKQNPKRATLDDLRDFFNETIDERNLKNILSSPGFDSIKIGGITFYFPATPSNTEKGKSP